MHLRRSHYTLDKAIISMGSRFDANKMEYLIHTCKQLQHLQLTGNGVIGNSLTTALPFAQNLSVLIVSENCEITPRVILSALKTCQKTLVEATFLRVCGRSEGDFNQWPKLESLRSLDLRFHHSYLTLIDFVCSNLPWHHGRHP
jgi:F-box/TPR repeat protein Pof3